MSGNLRRLQNLEHAALAAIGAAVAAVEALAVERENIPRLTADFRATADHELAVSAFADSLHAHESALAKYLLTQLSTTVLGKLVHSHFRQIYTPYGYKPAA